MEVGGRIEAGESSIETKVGRPAARGWKQDTSLRHVYYEQ